MHTIHGRISRVSHGLLSPAGLLLAILATLGACDSDEESGPTPVTPQPPPPAPPGLPPPPTVPALIPQTIAALGSAETLQALETLAIQSTGIRAMIGENYLPRDRQIMSDFTVDIAYDVKGERLRLDYVRNNFEFVRVTERTTHSEIIIEDLGHITGADSVFGFPAGDMTSDRWASTLRQQYLLNPHLILQDVLARTAQAAEVSSETVDGKGYRILEIADAVSPLRLYIDPESGLPAKLVTAEHDHFYCDVPLEVTYGDWRTVGDLQFPFALTISLNEVVIHEETRASIGVNALLDDALFALPTGANPVYDEELADQGMRTHQFHQTWSSFGVPLDGKQTYIDAEELSPGVYHLRGGTHHSLLIEQAERLVLVEAPLYPERSQAILDWIATNVPGKPLTHVIATHHHVDHASGMRTFVAEGTSVVVGAEIEELFASVFEAECTILPDRLEEQPVDANMIPVSERLVLDDAANPVEVVPMPTEHAAGMVLIYLPNQKLAFNSDMYAPGFTTVQPARLVEMQDTFTDYGMELETLVGGHGAGAGSYAAFYAEYEAYLAESQAIR